jgi:hypothetical protein
MLTNAPTFIIEVVRIVDHIFLENKRNEKLGGIIVIQNLFEIEAMICSFLFQFSFHFLSLKKSFNVCSKIKYFQQKFNFCKKSLLKKTCVKNSTLKIK